MRFESVSALTDIKQGSNILVRDKNNEATFYKVPLVKVSEHDGTEVILNKRLNKYVNVGMYLQGKSWVEEIIIVHAK